MLIFSISFSLAYTNGEMVTIAQGCINSTYANISQIYTEDGEQIFFINTETAMVEVSDDSYQYNFSNTTINSKYRIIGSCDVDGIKTQFSPYFEITPTGKTIDDDGQVSVGLLYFFLFLGLGFTGLGFLFLRNTSLWISYTGLFIMLIGFTFLYYDLMLSNVFANTIAINSGAGNITSGALLVILRFIKIAPYLVAGIIAFASVKVLKETIKKRKNSDGWDDGNY